MPSHEAILKVAKQHKLPPPVLTAPQQQMLAAPQRQAVAPAAEGSRAQEPRWQQEDGGDEAAATAAAALASAGPRPCLPVFRPASASGTPRSSLEVQRKAEEQARREAAEAAAAAYGEPWQSRKERVQAASPHGRWVAGALLPACSCVCRVWGGSKIHPVFAAAPLRLAAVLTCDWMDRPAPPCCAGGPAGTYGA